MEAASVMDVSGSALEFHRLRLEVIASNLANAQATKGEDGTLYQPLEVIAHTREGMPAEVGTGIQAVEVVPRGTPPRMVYNPAHPDANAGGYVLMPDINPVDEMTALVTSTRLYEANVRVIKAAQAMHQRALEIGQR